jgi:hypothetical protein
VPFQKERVNGDASREEGLMSRKRQKNQYELAFMTETGSEAPTNGEMAELLMAKQEPESGGTSEQLMESICEPENMRKALKRVQENKGAPGIDGITVEELPGYLRRNWPKHREELLQGTYKPKPARREEELVDSLRNESTDTAGDVAGSAGAVGPDILRAQLWISTGAIATSSGSARRSI